MDFKKLLEKHRGSLKLIGFAVIIIFCALYFYNQYNNQYTNFHSLQPMFIDEDRTSTFYNPYLSADETSTKTRESNSYSKVQQPTINNEPSQKTINTAFINIEVKVINESLKKIISVAKSHKGYVVRDFYSYDKTKKGSIVIKVPASEFDVVLEELRQIGKVESESISFVDVTTQYVDLDARLNSLKAQEKRYLAILDKAETVEDILRVEKELSRVRSDIESMQGTMNYLNNQITYSEILISVHMPQEKQKPVYDFDFGLVDTLYTAFRTFVNSLQSLIIFISGILPWAIVIWGAWLIWKKFVVKNKKQ